MKNRWKMYALGILVATNLVACSDSADANENNDSNNNGKDVGVVSGDVGNAGVDKDVGNVGQTDVGGEDTGTTSDVGEAADTGNQPASGLSGVWAQQTVMSSISKVPVVGQVTTATKTIQKVVISGTGPDYIVRSTPCAVEMESSSTLVKTVVPDAFVRGLVTTNRTLKTTGNTFDMPRFLEVRGVRLTNIETDAMPTDDTDERVFDQDSDGKPGMTVRVTGLIDGEIYVIQRGATQLAGTLANDRLDGLLVWSDEQVILGSDNSILAGNQPENKVDPKPENSFFRTTRLSGDLTCEAIVQQAETLFAR